MICAFYQKGLWVSIFLILALVGGGMSLCFANEDRAGNPAPESSDHPPQADTVDGLILPFNDYNLGSPVEAVVSEVTVDAGDWVEEGDVLAILHTDQELLMAEKAAKHLEQAEFMHRANERLAKERAVSQENAMESRIAYELAAIQSKLAKAVIEEKTLRAPSSGQIIRIHRKPGEIITRSDQLIDLLDYRQVYLQLYLPGRLIGNFSEGQEIEVEVPLVQQTFQSEVSFVDPVIDPGSGLFRLQLLIDNARLLIKPGMEGYAKLGESLNVHEALAAPATQLPQAVQSP